jgi:hypothetical protein
MRKVLMLNFRRTLFISLLIASHVIGMSPEAFVSDNKKHAIVLSFDIDDVISGKEKVGLWDYASLVPYLIYNHPKILLAFWPQNYKQIRQEAAVISKSTNGAFNIVHKVIQWINRQGYGDLSGYEVEIVERSQKPYPVQRMINNIQELKKNGFVVVGATNQDYMQHQAYRKFFKNTYNIDLNVLFDAVLTTRVEHVAPPSGEDASYRLQPLENIYAARNINDFKPHAGYFQALKHMIAKLVPYSKKIIHSDDKQENVQAAQQAGLHAIHFNLPTGSIRKSTPAQIAAAIDSWKGSLAELGVSIGTYY